MRKLIQSFLASSSFKLLLKLLASFASAIVVISGYLLFISMNSKNDEDESREEKKTEDLEQDTE
ncbi:hypothetical protein KKA14_12555 [bacterium]|nr:hypothetical protein [bacterium]